LPAGIFGRAAAVAFAAALAVATVFCSSMATAAADPAKVLRVAFEAEETGFDPVKVTDSYSNRIIEVAFERLLTYDYLARPAKLVPMAAETLPEVSPDAKSYVFKLRKGVFYTPDPAFKGARRELVAQDVAYSIKRLMDPANRSPWRFLVDGKIVGLDAVAKNAATSNKFDYDAAVAGLEVVDKHTLRVKLTATDFNFAYIMAMPALSIVAREVIEAYHDDTNAHPVGTGPYILKSWTRKAKMILEANPDYRGFVWDFAAGDPTRDDPVIKEMRGRKMPQIGRVEVSVIQEEQSRWLAFQRGEIDLTDRFGSFAPIAIPENKLAPDLAARGIYWDRSIEPEITYYFFNMKDPVVGGYTKERVALRRALILSYDIQQEIKVIRKNQAVADTGPIPAGVVGFDPKYRNANQYDPALANKLLDAVGYKKGPDGYRTDPSGKPVTIVLTSEPQAISREYDELWKKSLDAIGVRFEARKSPFSDNIKAGEACQLMMWGSAWHADYPDGENFMQLLYGPNTHQSNHACYESKAFDAMYDRIRSIPNSPERDQILLEMSRLVEVDGVWKMGVSRYRNVLVYPQVRGYRHHPIMEAIWPYLDIDNAKRRK
jgi:ABC-type transport system substrate-binding protein